MRTIRWLTRLLEGGMNEIGRLEAADGSTGS
jgi:hypothetical protein